MSNIVEYRARDGQMVKLNFETIRRYLVAGRSEFVTQQELIYFMGICKSRGLNPFAKDCYLVKYTQGDNAAIIVSRGHYQARAKQQPDCRGWQSGIVVQNGKGELVEREGHLILDDETLVGGWASARISGWDEPKKHTVPLRGYIKLTREGRPTQFWSQEKQPMMIEKIAEVQLLRSLWSQEFAHLHVEEEIVQAEIPTFTPEPESMKSKVEKIIAEPEATEPQIEEDDEVNLFWHLKEIGFKRNLPAFLQKYPEWPGAVQARFNEKYKRIMGKEFGSIPDSEQDIEPETPPEREPWNSDQHQEIAAIVETKFGGFPRLFEWCLATGRAFDTGVPGGLVTRLYADAADQILADVDGAKAEMLDWFQSQGIED